MSDTSSSNRLDLTTDEDFQSEASSTSSKISWKNVRLTFKRLSKKEVLTEGEKMRLASAKRIIEENDRRKSQSVASTTNSIASENRSLVKAMEKVDMVGVKSSDIVSNTESEVFHKVNDAFEIIKEFNSRDENLLCADDQRKLSNARDLILRWSQLELEGKKSLLKTEGKIENKTSKNFDLTIPLALATAEAAKMQIDKPLSSSSTSTVVKSLYCIGDKKQLDEKNEGTDTLPTPLALATADAVQENTKKIDKPLSLSSNSWVRKGVDLTSTLLTSSPLSNYKGKPSSALFPLEIDSGSANHIDEMSHNLESVDPGCSKRDRTKDTGSPEVTVIKKRKTDIGKNVYNEGCIGVAIIDDGSSDTRIGDDNWKLLESRLLFLVSETVRDGSDAMPFFGNIQTRNGHKVLYCKTDDTLTWLRDAIGKLNGLWDGAKLRLIEEKELPQQPRIKVFIMGPILPKDRLLDMLIAQNRQVYPSSDWKILRMDQPTEIGRNVILAVNIETLKRLELNGFRISVGLSSAIARPIVKGEERTKAVTAQNRRGPDTGAMGERRPNNGPRR